MTRWSATRRSSRRAFASASRPGSPARRYPCSTSAGHPPGSPSVHPAHDSDCASRSPPLPSLRLGSSISATRPNFSRRTSAAERRSSISRERRRCASRRMRPTRSANSSRSPVTWRASSQAVSAWRSRSASATSSFTVLAAWPSTNPASQSGYQSRSATSATFVWPSCTSTTSTSEPGLSSARPYEPTAATASRPPWAPAAASDRVREASSSSASARPNAGPRRL